jgi:hydroxymethylpyrimidine pyrophosphatase-like HAD family hydrolase
MSGEPDVDVKPGGAGKAIAIEEVIKYLNPGQRAILWKRTPLPF